MDDSPPSPGAPGGARIVDGAFFASLAMETSFYILRHGQSAANATRTIQGRLDIPLDEAGRAQAREASAWLAGRGIEEIVSSPLSRAAETARIASAACGLGEPSFDDRLVELDTGIFTGLSLDEVRARFPSVYAEFQYRSWEGVPEAESCGALYARAVEVWTMLRDRAARGRRTVACVTHGGLIQWLLRSTFGCRSWMPLVPTGNCGIYELAVAPAGGGKPACVQWKLVDFQPASTAATTLPFP